MIGRGNDNQVGPSACEHRIHVGIDAGSRKFVGHGTGLAGNDRDDRHSCATNEWRMQYLPGKSKTDQPNSNAH
jgi:hypothetical protein